jgi:hypothetical protein
MTKQLLYQDNLTHFKEEIITLAKKIINEKEIFRIINSLHCPITQIPSPLGSNYEVLIHRCKLHKEYQELLIRYNLFNDF